MTYSQAIDYIMSRRKFQKSNGHERIERLLELLGNPHKSLKYIHVVGTNGKGSVSTAMSYILKDAGYKTGLFTSPYIVEFGERIQINNTYISHEDIATLTALIKEKTDLMESEELYPTVFEVTTALAFLYFAKEECDIVILEAGIGGEHDSTNVIPPPLECIFMSISLDHTEMLGDTITKIATEKSGIIKSGTTVISYPDSGESFGFIPQSKEATNVIRSKCLEMCCKLTLPDTDKLKVIRSDISGSEFVYDTIKITTRLCSAHQIANMITATEAMKKLRDLGFTVSDENIIRGIYDFTIPGRMEIHSQEPLIIHDGGHNEGCLRALKAMAEAYLKDKKITLLMSFMKDKDYTSSLSIIAPLAENIIFTLTDPVRGETPEVLAESAKAYCKNIFCCQDPADAYRKALSLSDNNSALIVTGSFYLVSEIRNMKVK
jgi:dihydrofolate synthase/folylpolyglutamate synthase